MQWRCLCLGSTPRSPSQPPLKWRVRHFCPPLKRVYFTGVVFKDFLKVLKHGDKLAVGEMPFLSHRPWQLKKKKKLTFRSLRFLEGCCLWKEESVFPAKSAIRWNPRHHEWGRKRAASYTMSTTHNHIYCSHFLRLIFPVNVWDIAPCPTKGIQTHKTHHPARPKMGSHHAIWFYPMLLKSGRVRIAILGSFFSSYMVYDAAITWAYREQI